ncbi:MAG: GDYXXLXY domain-containing protein [Verrucomicrobiota bacterium]|nr:GDYXXLXY domain-containing protein [Verrucomicrobiota bacterium]
MNRARILWLLFAVAAIAQVAIPLALIYRFEHILAKGEPVHFRMTPRDPYDPFRGRYMRLNFSIGTNHPIAEATSLVRHQTAYAILDIDPDGFATVKELTPYKPWKGRFLKVKVTWAQGSTAAFVVPFDRYYMNETRAPEAERQLAERLRNTASTTNTDPALSKDYAIVRLLDGRGVVEDLVLDGKPIREWLKESEGRQSSGIIR